MYFPALDVLRFVLALSVAAYHAGMLPWHRFGDLPVQIFFALSGWLIGGILVRSKVSDLPRFYWHRALRIWPPYFAAVVILLALGLAKDNLTAKWLEFAFYKLTLTFNLFGAPQWPQYRFAPMQGQGAMLWSIGAEEQFYLIAPFLITLLPFGRSPFSWAIIALLVLVSPAYHSFAAVSVGVVAAVSIHKLGDWHRTTLGQTGLVLLLFATSLSFFTPAERFFDAMFGIPIVLLLARPGSPSKILSLAGGVSFPLYLNHWLGIWLVTAACHRLGLSIGTAERTAMVITGIAIATALYFVIDIPAKKYRDILFTERRGAAAAIAAIILVSTGIVGGLLLAR
ncbi:acyltransferase [Frankia sp. RB7]|nr:acyltransferase [Frankia sp. RB7]